MRIRCSAIGLAILIAATACGGKDEGTNVFDEGHLMAPADLDAMGASPDGLS